MFFWKKENEGRVRVKASESKLEMKEIAEPLMGRTEAASREKLR